MVFAGVGCGHDAHSQMVGHITADHGVALANPACSEIHGLVESVVSLGTGLFQAPYILQSRFYRQRQGQKGGVGREHILVFYRRVQGKRGTAKGLVLIIHFVIEGKIPRFGTAPKLFRTVIALLIQGKTERFVKKSIPVNRKKKRRHKIFKCGAGPG